MSLTTRSLALRETLPGTGRPEVGPEAPERKSITHCLMLTRVPPGSFQKVFTTEDKIS